MFVIMKRHLGYLNVSTLGSWLVVIFVEIFIVVFGVYGAAGLGQWREAERAQERQREIVTALGNEIDPFLDEWAAVVARIRDDYQGWRARYGAGERPPPFVLPSRISLDHRPSGALWLAILDSSDTGILPVESIRQLGEFYALTERVPQQYAAITDFAREQILPFAEQGQGRYYQGDSVRLRALYESYDAQLQGLIGSAERMLEIGRTVRGGPLFTDSRAGSQTPGAGP
jgi:hypothetical protein